MKCYAFTDESGNSGLNLFDPEQDVFWSGTLIAFADVDTKYRTAHEELLAIVGKTELHGAELGLGGIDKIAARLSCLIREKKLHFSFVRLYKPFLAASKLFDLAFDSGNNAAMPPLAYGIRLLRLINLLHFVQLLTTKNLKEFWSLFQAQDAGRFRILLGELAERAKQAPYDQRSLQILSDVLTWGCQHPEAVLDPFDEGHSPNFVAFSGLFSHLHSLHELHGHSIASFVHDEQNQFAPSLRTGFEHLSKFKAEGRTTSMISDIKLLPTFDCKLVIRPSSQSFGLQLIDVCMWIVRRVFDRDDELHGNCRDLFECLVGRSWLSRFDFESLVEEVQAGVDQIQGPPLSGADLARGRAMLQELEISRLSRMKASERGVAG